MLRLLHIYMCNFGSYTCVISVRIHLQFRFIPCTSREHLRNAYSTIPSAATSLGLGASLSDEAPIIAFGGLHQVPYRSGWAQLSVSAATVVHLGRALAIYGTRPDAEAARPVRAYYWTEWPPSPPQYTHRHHRPPS